MILTICSVFTRIFSNSFLNVFQKILTNEGEANSVINFYTYFGLTIFSLLLCPNFVYSKELFSNFFIMGIFGCLGNYYIIKSLSCGEMSSIAPINSYKPIIALIVGIFLLHEFPSLKDLMGIFLIILGTIYLSKSNLFFSKAFLYRFFALCFSATEAIFIKKIILLTDVKTSFFYWALAGLLFAFSLVLFSKHNFKIEKAVIKYQVYLILMVAIMQYSTNYLFSKMNVSSALALFQLSTILSVFLGAKFFKEKGFIKKLIGSVIMVLGAVIIILG